MSSSFVPPSVPHPPRRDIFAPSAPPDSASRDATPDDMPQRPVAPRDAAQRDASHRISPPRGVEASIPLVQQDLHATRPPHTPRSMPRTTPGATIRATPAGVPKVGVNTAQLNGWRFAAIAAVVACAATGVQLYRVMQQRDVLRQDVQAHGLILSKQGAALQTDLGIRDRTIRALTAPSMQVIDLRSYRSPTPVGRVFWDRASGEWMMYTYTLSAPQPGSVYQLWVVTHDGRSPFSAGTFTPDRDGSATVRVNYPIDPKTFERIAISEEPAGGSVTPGKHIVLAGR